MMVEIQGKEHSRATNLHLICSATSLWLLMSNYIREHLRKDNLKQASLRCQETLRPFLQKTGPVRVVMGDVREVEENRGRSILRG